MQNTNLKALAQECHATNVNNGFWKIETPKTLRRLLIITEISEAIEALRKDRKVNVIAIVDNMNYCDLLELIRQKSIDEFKDVFELTVKDTFEDEIADTVIRIFDYCEGYNTDTGIDYEQISRIMNPIQEKEKIWNEFYLVIMYLYDLDFTNAIYRLFKIAKFFNFDLIKHIQLKNEYNKTRGYLHGKKF